MFGFYKTNGFTPLCPLEMAATGFHARYDVRAAGTTRHKTNGDTSTYAVCLCYRRYGKTVHSWKLQRRIKNTVSSGLERPHAFPRIPWAFRFRVF